MRMLAILFLMTLTAAAHTQVERQDPTRPPTQAEIEAWFGNGTDARERAPFHLQAILLSPKRRIAIIDGQRFRVGERLDNAQVRAIEPGLVVLDREGERIELNINTHLTDNNDGSRD